MQRPRSDGAICPLLPLPLGGLGFALVARSLSLGGPPPTLSTWCARARLLALRTVTLEALIDCNLGAATKSFASLVVVGGNTISLKMCCFPPRARRSGNGRAPRDTVDAFPGSSAASQHGTSHGVTAPMAQ